MQIVTDGIVLKEVKTGEADRILTILTRSEGLITASAKRSMRLKNKLVSATGLLCWSDFTLFRGKTMYSIDDAQSKNVFFELRNDVQVLSLALYMSELVSNFVLEDSAAGEYLDFLLAGFRELCKETKTVKLIKSAFELRLMSISGYMPNLVACTNCGQYEKISFYFDVQNGELLCANCCEGEMLPNITPSTLLAMRHIVFSEQSKIYQFTLGEKNLDNLNNVTTAFMQYHTDKPIKTLDFLMQVLD